MTHQEIFDHVVTFLLNQGKQSANEHGDCLYRGPNGTMCAAGCLIKDEHYHPDLEENLATTFPVTIALENSGIRMDQKTEALVYELQTAHDNVRIPLSGSQDFMVFFPYHARQIAKKFDLSTATLDSHPKLTKE